MPTDPHPERAEPARGSASTTGEQPASGEQELPDWLRDAIAQSNREARCEQADLSPRKSAGRPARGDAKRTHRVGISLSADELEVWHHLAQTSGRGSVARWARERVMSSIALQELGHSDVGGEVAGLRADLGRVGNNLNQIARALNTAERSGADGPTSGEVLTAVAVAREQLAEIREWTRRQS
ncbi:plasmid mobilization relaxosome protein MobC [Brachybacterium tyrofermentans]|uniref:plasmid mobilization relaxosome protein MobC n=1 Tax=Brachybacterium tyrofermentans TaxID=47848 RepID=UPI003FD2177D